MSVYYSSLVGAVDSNWSGIEKLTWLFDEKTVQKGVKLEDNEVELFGLELRKQGFKAADVKKWVTMVTARKKKGLSHIDITNIYINGDTQYKHDPAQNRIMYARSSWHMYKDGVWNECEDWIIELELQNLLEEIEKKRGFQFTSGSQRSIMSFIQQKLYVAGERLDSDNNWINVKNGVYDLESETLIPHDPSQMLTRQMNVIYDPSATSDLWDSFKRQVIGGYTASKVWNHDEEAIQFLDEVIGYSFTTSVKHEIMIWCLGEGRNGKGVLFHVIQSIAGSSAMNINLNTLERNAYQLAMIGGKTALLCTEADKKVDIANDGTIKAIVSGEGVMVRQIRERPFVLESKAKIWWSFNNAPNVRDTSEGFWRRVKVIPFNRSFDESTADKNLKHKIIEDDVLSAVFNSAIKAYGRVRKSGKFTESKLIQLKTTEYKTEENVVQSFVLDCCDMIDGEKCSSTELYTEYKDWCNRFGYMPYSVKNFKSEMTRLKIYPKRKSSGVIYEGIRIKPVIGSNKVWS